MFEKLSIPVIGMIENMSQFVCPHCGVQTDVFSHAGAKRAAIQLGIPFLGEIPLDIDLRLASDEGQPLAVFERHEHLTSLYNEIADKIIQNQGRIYQNQVR
jgi:ATP-binding protein involved in chromosome partitioning